MGRITVRDLFETDPDAEIVIADFNLKIAEKLASSFRSRRARLASKRVQATFADLRDEKSLLKAMRGGSVVINSTPYIFNVPVMQAALKAGIHYVDLGGLFHVTRKQLKLHEQFKKAGLLALLGMGAAPGITNIMADHAVSRLDQVQAIHIRLGGKDLTRYDRDVPISVSYSLDTILDEFSFQPAVFQKGRFQFVEPMSGIEAHPFPSPVGIQKPMYTIHSEVATLPLSYKDKKIREVSFKIAFDESFTERVRFLRDLGFASRERFVNSKITFVPREILMQLISHLPKEKPVGPIKQYEVIRSIVLGKEKGKKVGWIVDCHTKGMPQWGIGLDIDTGAPPSIAAQMVAHGEISSRGALPPEKVVPPQPFFKELSRRGMTIKIKKIAGWHFL
ncbi:MAG: saccharopine dehydrogenase NADP-binding domain-containing protein [Deltaproteobacteria bacterium]|nr:saccharopine dehydrogenase NADP-binding domain-containing protein [Deltaproteobacteria bacterium]